MHQVHTSPPAFPKVHSNIILPSTLRSSEWSLPIRFSDHNFIRISHLFHACYVPHLSHLPWLNRPNNIRWRVQVMQLLTIQSSIASCQFFPTFGIYYQKFSSITWSRLRGPLHGSKSESLLHSFIRKRQNLHTLTFRGRQSVTNTRWYVTLELHQLLLGWKK
jgi:hypothetical protein